MKTELYYFTGTGNSLSIAKKIKEVLLDKGEKNIELVPIGSGNMTGNISSEADRVGLIFPTYDFSAPNIVKKFAKRLQIAEKCYVFLYVNSAGAPGNSASSIKLILESNDISVKSAFSVVFPDNSVYYEPKNVAQVLGKAEKVISIDANDIYECNENLNMELLKHKLINTFIGTIYDVVTKGYLGFNDISIKGDCNSCGKCQKVCPVNNIEMKGQEPSFGTNCEMCFACIHQCPKKALGYKRMKKEFEQYLHPEVETEELIYR